MHQPDVTMPAGFSNRMRLAVLGLACILPVGAAWAQPIYRCGPDGREYSQTPCPGGRLLDLADPRSAAQRAEARDVAAREARLATRLEAQRRQAESSAKPPGAASLSPRPAQKPVADPSPGKPKTKKAAADEPFIATVPRRSKAKSTSP